MPRPLLLRIDNAATLDQLNDRVQGRMTADVDGVEWGLPGEVPATDQVSVDGCGVLSAGPKVLSVAAACADLAIPSAASRVTRLLGLASSLGAKVLNLALPAVEREATPRFSRYQEGLNFTYELLHRLRLDAEAAGVALAVEAPSLGCLLSPVELRDLVDAANSWAVGVCLDLQQLRPIGSASDWMTTLGPRVQAVRAGARDAETDTLAIAIGRMPPDRPLIACHSTTLQWALRLREHATSNTSTRGFAEKSARG